MRPCPVCKKDDLVQETYHNSIPILKCDRCDFPYAISERPWEGCCGQCIDPEECEARELHAKNVQICPQCHEYQEYVYDNHGHISRIWCACGSRESDTSWYTKRLQSMKAAFDPVSPALVTMYVENKQISRALCHHKWQCSEDGYTCVRCGSIRL